MISDLSVNKGGIVYCKDDITGSIEMHRCKYCDVWFDKTMAYMIHRRKEHPRFSCPDCGKVFGFMKKLKYHLRGCRENRKRADVRQDSGRIISFSNYKRLPIVTAKELDTEFEIYMNRKFGKKGVFRNEKMCKFCCKPFVMASDFADHIRDHYKSIPLDATGVKSKFDFMQFMGLKIRETNDSDSSNKETQDDLKNKMNECKVVITGERCRICSKSFKCSTDLDHHNKAYHSSTKKRDRITLVLKIGDEIISRIPLNKRHIRRGGKIAHRSNCKRLKIRSPDLYESLKYPSNYKNVGRETETLQSKNVDDRTSYVEIVEERSGAQSSLPSDKYKVREFCLQSEINQAKGNTIRYSQDARGKKEIVEQVELDTADEAENDFDSVKSIYADEFFDGMQFSEPWKTEFTENSNPSWFSEMKLKENGMESDQESCYCIEMREPILMPKGRDTWEKEPYNDMLNIEEATGSCEELTFHDSPPIYKYSSDSKHQADFSFPSDERSYGFQVRHVDNEETNNNQKSHGLSYKAAITVSDQGRNLDTNLSRSLTRQYEDRSFRFQDLEIGKTAVHANNKYQEVLIKEEVILDDCNCCVNDVYPSLSHLSA